MSENHKPVPTPVIQKDRLGEPEWVAFNWKTRKWKVRPEAGLRFEIVAGTWTGDWIVRAHDAERSDIFFAERISP